MKKILIFTIVLLVMILGAGCNNSKKKSSKTGEAILVGAAVSLISALNELEPIFEKQTGVNLELQFAASGTLKEQIKNGAPIDVFFSAAQKDVDELVAAELLTDSKVLLHNQLVLIKTKMSTVKSVNDLRGIQYIAVGDPRSVPVGRYIQEALKKIGLYDSLQSKFTIAKDVSQVLSWVEQGNAEVGFVYYSDYVRSKNKVDLVEKIDSNKHTKIAYPIGIVKSSKHRNEAKKFIEFLSEYKAKKVFENCGFILAQ